MRLRTPVASVVLVLGLLPACSSSSSGGADGGTPSDGGSPTKGDGGGLTSSACGAIPLNGPQQPDFAGACVSCVNSMCCAEGTACGSDTDCLALVTCIAACPSGNDPSCDELCETGHPNGVTTASAAVTCEITTCNAACENFSCLGSISWPTPAASTYTFKYTPTDYSTGKPIVGATVKVCATSDAQCAKPSAMYTTGPTGVVMVTAPSAPGGIDGYLEVSASTYETTLAFISEPGGGAVLAAAGTSIEGIVLPTQTFSLLSGVLGGQDATLGALTVGAVDCAGYSASGVSLSVSTATSKTIYGYIAGSLPSATAKSTDSSGTAGILNVPPGAATVTSTLASSGKRIGTAQIVLRAGAITSVNALPTP